MKLSPTMLKTLRHANDWEGLYSPFEDGSYARISTIDALIVRGMLSARVPNNITKKGEKALESHEAPVRVAPGIYSHLSPATLKELRRCCKIAFPKHMRRNQYIALACRPATAIDFINNPEFNP